MNEEQLYGVAVRLSRNYNGRGYHGEIQETIREQGTLMTRECAEKLCAVLKADYPQAHVVPLLRGDRDAMAATSLAELGEAFCLDKLESVVQQSLIQGFGADEILLKCQSTIAEAAAEFAKQQRIQELEAETRRLKAVRE